MLRLICVAVVLMMITALLGLQHHASADLSSCSVNISPQSVSPGSDNYFVFGLNDTDANSINWIHIISPGGQYFTVESASAYQWQGATTADDATFTEGSMNSGGSENFSVEALTGGNTTSSPVDWQVQASDDPGGADPITCSGDLSVSIVQPPTQINISNVGVTDVSSSSATVTWTTDAASTSQVDYGLDSNYGSNSDTDNSLVTSHTVTLNNLESNTGYHFQVVSTTPDGGYANSGDNTLLTAVQDNTPAGSNPSSSSSSSSSNSSSGGSSSGSPIGITITNPADKTPPTIAFTNLSATRVFKTAPTMTGQAGDNIAVQRVEYSTDGGQDWLPVDSAPSPNTAQTTFSFTPLNLDDGTYKIMARAIDDGGNITNTPIVTIVIDRLPPTIGGNLLSFGPQVLVPSSGGVITSLAGVDQRVTLSAVGGPTNISLVAQKAGSKNPVQVFNLTESPDTLLWSGIVSIKNPGEYHLVSNGVDGAGIKTTQVVSVINIIGDPRVYSQRTHKSVEATVSLYYLDPDSNSWVIWDGSSYGEANPQTTDNHGDFKLFIPPGTYYLRASAPGYETLISSIFKTNQSEPLTTSLALKPHYELPLGLLHISLPTLAIQNVNLSTPASSGSATSHSGLIGKPLPDFSLTETNGTTVHAADLLGRPTLITLGATWSPTMSEQLAILEKLQANPNLNIIPVALQQSSGQVQAYTSIAGLDLNWLVDPDSTLSPAYGSPNLPTQYFVDRNGIVRQVYVGVLSQSQIENKLLSL